MAIRIKVGLKFDDEFAIINEIIEEIKKVVNRHVDNLAEDVATDFRERIIKDVHNSPEYLSLIDGKLRDELGVFNPFEAMEEIIDVWASSFSVEPIVKQKLIFELRIGYDVGGSWQKLTGLSVASYRYFSFTYKDSITIPWLKWLLTFGNKPAVLAHEVAYDLRPEASRTGNAIMVPSPTVFQHWRVPPEFAGDKNHNMFTRSLKQSVIGLNAIFIDALEKYLE